MLKGDIGIGGLFWFVGLLMICGQHLYTSPLNIGGGMCANDMDGQAWWTS